MATEQNQARIFYRMAIERIAEDNGVKFNPTSKTELIEFCKDVVKGNIKLEKASKEHGAL